MIYSPTMPITKKQLNRKSLGKPAELTGNHYRLSSGVLFSILLAILLFLPCPAKALSLEDERELGEKVMVEIRRQLELVDEPDITSYIRKLGNEVLSVTGPQPFNYQFNVVQSREFNAFAAPSGLIFIFSGLIEVSESEGELLSVIAHEVGHAVSRHIASRMEKMKRVSIGSGALALAGMVLGGHSAIGQAVMTGSLAGGATMGLEFSRRDEEEADLLALRWMKEMGRDPAEMVSMFRKMRNISRFRRAQMPAYLLTHPEPEQRISYVELRLDMKNLPTRVQPRPGDEYFDFEFHRVRQRIFTLGRSPQELLPSLRHRLRNGDDAPADFMARFGLSQVFLADRQYDRALEEINKVIARFPNQYILYTDRAIIEFEAGRHEEALSSIDKAIKNDPNNPYTLFNLARMMQQSGRLDEARAIYERLLTKLPDSPRLNFRYGQVRSSLGDQAAGHLYLGLHHWYAGEGRMARYHLSKAIKLDEEEGQLQQKAKDWLQTVQLLGR